MPRRPAKDIGGLATMTNDKPSKPIAEPKVPQPSERVTMVRIDDGKSIPLTAADHATAQTITHLRPSDIVSDQGGDVPAASPADAGAKKGS